MRSNYWVSLLVLTLTLSITTQAAVSPLLETSWGQDGVWQSETPIKDGLPTYPGCTTIATAQLLYYYQYQNTANQDVSYALEHRGLSHQDISDDQLSTPLSTLEHDWVSMAKSAKNSVTSQRNTAKFIYHVATSLNAQFGGGEGSTATGKQIENAFRYQWGFNNKPRREMSIITKSAFGYGDDAWAELIRSELDAGRPVLYMAQQQDADAGHAFIIDGYRDDGKVHVNWGWSGRFNGYYDPNTLTDPSGRSWSRNAMIYRGLEPEDGYAVRMKKNPILPNSFAWHGNGSIISYNSGKKTGFGLTRDEAVLAADQKNGAVLFQWQVDKRDGTVLEITADRAKTANVTYGIWNDRSEDKLYRNVTLPFTLDPAADGYQQIDQEYFVIAVTFNEQQFKAGIVSVAAKHKTSDTASTNDAIINSVNADRLIIDQHLWQGNGSLISFTTNTLDGYGITRDELALSPSDRSSVGFFQWEVDSRDGKKLEIRSDSTGLSAKVTYGYWNDRQSDKSHAVNLPFILNPESDGFTLQDNDYLTIKVEFLDPIRQPSVLEAIIVN